MPETGSGGGEGDMPVLLHTGRRAHGSLYLCYFCFLLWGCCCGRSKRRRWASGRQLAGQAVAAAWCSRRGELI